MGKRDVFHNCQTKSGAAKFAAPRFVCPVESFKDPGEIGLGNPLPLVNDFDLKFRVVAVQRGSPRWYPSR